ncbi:MAG: hypothetical protein HYU66_26910 [Armatimonadetes bacterium]|nr:hypothetical protein [Armatimonadota bacterium]
MTSSYRAAGLCVLAMLALTGCSKPAADSAPPAAPGLMAPAPAPAPVAQPVPPPEPEQAKLAAPAPPPEPKPREEAKAAEPVKPPETKAKEKPAPPATPVATKAKEKPAAPAKPVTAKPKEKPRGLVVLAEVETVSKVPDPGSVPYKDCLTMIKYKVVSVESGTYDGAELLAAHRGMRDGKLTAAAHLKVGERLTLTIEPLDKHPEASRMMSADDTGEYSLTPYLVTASH